MLRFACYLHEIQISCYCNHYCRLVEFFMRLPAWLELRLNLSDRIVSADILPQEKSVSVYR